MTVITESEAFKSLILEELSSADASLPFDIKNYLTELLLFYLFTDRLFEYKKSVGGLYEETLVEIYKQIQEAEFYQKIHLLKKMGDFSLYMSGFFRSAIKRKIVDVSYYEEMGKTAYGQLAESYKDKESVFNSLYLEFKNLTDILFYIHKKLGLQTDKNYLELCDEYLETDRQPVLQRILKEEDLV